MTNRSTFVEFSVEPAVKPISISPTIERHRLTALINTNLCEPYTATISIEANSERDALVLFEWFKHQAEAASAPLRSPRPQQRRSPKSALNSS